MDYFTKNAENYKDLTNAALIERLNNYCAQQISVMRDTEATVVRTAITALFNGMRENSGVLLRVAAERYGLDVPASTNPHQFLGKIAQSAYEQDGITDIDNMRKMAQLTEAAHKKIAQITPPPTNFLSKAFSDLKVYREVPESTMILAPLPPRQTGVNGPSGQEPG